MTNKIRALQSLGGGGWGLCLSDQLPQLWRIKGILGPRVTADGRQKVTRATLAHLRMCEEVPSLEGLL